MRLFYFGVRNTYSGGHFFIAPAHDCVALWDPREAGCPWGYEMDGHLQIGSALSLGQEKRHAAGMRAPEEQPEGVALLHHRGGWTALSFWDRSGDSRTGSNSSFFADDILTFEQITQAAKEQFPTIWARFTFPVTLFATIEVA